METIRSGYRHVCDLPEGEWHLYNAPRGIIALSPTHKPILITPGGLGVYTAVEVD